MADETIETQGSPDDAFAPGSLGRRAPIWHEGDP